ncbi:MAG: nuclear transport factor 2 family protein [Devosiaceae bacterium]|nr:nuclear transport factor 2 family protein [Devosiaceae bacterium MH13]
MAEPFDERNRASYLAFIDAQRHPGDHRAAFERFYAPDAAVNCVHPINQLQGAAIGERFLAPLTTAFVHLHRRDDIVMAGRFDGADWVSATGYYVGHWARPWLGIAPTGSLSYLRFGEFHRMHEGRAVESYIFLDIPELLSTSGCWPIVIGPGKDPGYRGMIQGPATQDGILRGPQDPAASAHSVEMVTEMLRGLATPDEKWRPYWHDAMMWYGPGAFGSFIGIEAFASFQVPFESQFEGWSGGAANNGITRHFTRYGEGNYTCSGGWPSLTGISVKPFLGEGPTGERVTMRVCDWWRREGDLLVENWVFVDVPHVLLQFGRDVLADVAQGEAQ